MNTKSFNVTIKNADRGEVTAIFSTFNVIDSDGDVTLPGAFEDGVEVPISAYGHASWQGALPVGKARIRQTDTQAILEGQFFMETQAGRDTFTVVKELGDLGQWSYGFDIVKHSFGEFEGRQVRFLERVKVHEVSPVLVGAGVGVRTLAAKAAGVRVPHGRKRAIPPHETPVVSRMWDGPRTVAAIPNDARPSELRTVFAWVDENGDPEAKSSYKFPHHHGVNGPANIRACLAGIAILNGARGGADIPDSDREGVYRHLAAHLRDADREPPELRAQPGGGPMKFAEEGHHALAVVSAFIDRASDVLALRRAKGRTGLAPSSAELLGWLEDEMRRLKRLLDAPTGDEDPTDEEIASLVAASIARIQGI